jgi:hypothetical protein
MALAVLLLAGCASNAPTGAGHPATVARDGSSIGNAIVIDAAGEQDGVRAEYQWIADHYPGYARGKQALVDSGGRMYDELDFTTASGEHRQVYFDITGFFGKF